MFTQLITYCKEAMMKNEHDIWAAYFLPSIFVQRCESSSSFVASKRREVYSCTCRTPADHCAIRAMLPYLYLAKCVRVHCWRASKLVQEAPTLSTHNIDMQCLTHPFTDSSGSVANLYARASFLLRHPLSFVMCLVNLVDLISLPFLFASHINPHVLCYFPFALILPSAPFVLVQPLLWCIISFSDPISLASFCSGILMNRVPWKLAVSQDGLYAWWAIGLTTLVLVMDIFMLRVDGYFAVVGLAQRQGRVYLVVDLDG